jgi:hypothetical protein
MVPSDAGRGHPSTTQEGTICPMTTVPPMRIAVLIASHNRRQLTERGLRSLLAQDCLGDLISELTIWLLDDGSSDGSSDDGYDFDDKIISAASARSGALAPTQAGTLPAPTAIVGLPLE